MVCVNPASLEDHQKYAAQLGFPYPIASDEGSKVAAAYGALKPEGGIQRTVYVIDRQGAVRYAVQGLPETEELLKQIEQIGEADNPPRRSGY